jgi:WD40 repeat protein
MIWGAAFSPDGRRLVTSCDDGAARWWDVATGAPLGEPLWHGGETGYYTLALSPDGRVLATGGKDMRVLRWDAETGEPLGTPLRLGSPVHLIEFLRDRRRLVVGTRDGGLHVWDAEASRVADLPAQGTSVTALAVSPNGRTFATGTAGGVLRLWDTTWLGQTGQTDELVVAVTGLAFHPDGHTLAVGQDDGTVRLLDVPRPKAVGPPLRIGSAVHQVAFSPDGRRLLTGSSKGAQWWDADSGQALGPLMHSTRYEPGGTVFSSDSRRTFDIVDMVEATALSPDGKAIATARWAGAENNVHGRAEVWDTATGERLGQTPEQPDPLKGVAFSPDSKRLLTWDDRPGSARLWDVPALRDGRPLLQPLGVPIRQAVFSADGLSLLVACRDGTARLWDVARDEEVAPDRRPRHGYPVTAVAFAPDGRRAVTGCQAGTIGLWDLARGALLHDARGNAGEVVAAAFSPDGQTVLTGSHDGTARFWDARSGRQLGPPLRHADAVLAVAFHPDGQTVATGTKDGLAQRWLVPAPPRPGSVAQTRAWVEAQTGLELDPQGVVHTSAPGAEPVLGR